MSGNSQSSNFSVNANVPFLQQQNCMRNKIHFDHLCRTSYPEGQSGNPDDEVKSNIMEVNDEEYEMTLPSGAKVGHR